MPAPTTPRALLLDLLWRERHLLRDLAGLLTPDRAPAASIPQSVLVLPGYLADDRATVLLRRHLRGRLGIDARGWGLGQNRGDIDEQVARLGERLAASGEAVVLIGWSLGGVVARQLARAHPTLVRGVITLGTPLHGLRGTAFAALYSPEHVDDSARRAEARERVPIPAPLAVLYTKQDPVVAWEQSLDAHNAHARHIEVACSHAGLVACREVYGHLAALLGGGLAQA